MPGHRLITRIRPYRGKVPGVLALDCLLSPLTSLLMHAYIPCLLMYSVLFYVIVLVCSRLAT